MDLNIANYTLSQYVPYASSGDTAVDSVVAVDSKEIIADLTSVNLTMMDAACDVTVTEAATFTASPPVQSSLAHIPLKSYLIKAFPFQVNCIGCNKAFPCYYTPKGFKKIPSPAYYVHCIDECQLYRAKDLIRSCEYCNFKFLDKEALGIHKNSCKASNKRSILAQKPSWMPVSIALTIINYSKFEGKTACRGCKQLFPCYRKGSKVVPSLEYYVHCIENCKEYRDKGWMKICSLCNCKFLNNQALVQHKRGCLK